MEWIASADIRYEVDGWQSMASKEWVYDSHVKLFTAISSVVF